MGTAIINAISSGFELLQDLAKNLVNGFSTLFIATSGETTTLTALGWVILVFFGISITIGALKLCLTIFRNRG